MVDHKLRDILVIPLVTFVVLILLKLSGVIPTYSIVIGTVSSLALVLGIRLIPSSGLRGIAYLLFVLVLFVSVLVPMIFNFLPFVGTGLNERRVGLGIWIGQKTGQEKNSLVVLRQYCRDMEEAEIKKLNNSLKSKDPSTLDDNLKRVQKIQELRQKCSENLLKYAEGTREPETKAGHKEEKTFHKTMWKIIGSVILWLVLVGGVMRAGSLDVDRGAKIALTLASWIIAGVLSAWLIFGGGAVATYQLFMAIVVASPSRVLFWGICALIGLASTIKKRGNKDKSIGQIITGVAVLLALMLIIDWLIWGMGVDSVIKTGVTQAIQNLKNP